MRFRNLAAAFMMAVVFPTTVTNCDVGSSHRDLARGLRVMRDVHRIETTISKLPQGIRDAILVPLQAATTQTVLSEQVRGVTSGAVTIPSGNTGGVRFDLVSSDWQTLAAGTDMLTVTVDRSFDGGSTWSTWYLEGPAPNTGPLCVAVPPKGTCSFFLAVELDGVGSVWRWTIVPSQPFSWGFNATF